MDKKVITDTDRRVYEMYARDGYGRARALLSDMSKDGLITVQQRERYANELAELEILRSPDRKWALKELGL